MRIRFERWRVGLLVEVYAVKATQSV